MKKYKVFLASSAELSMERKEIALMISRLNNAWVEKDLCLELVIWEDLLHSFREGGERIQDYFNREMLKCDIVIVLFFKKVGQFTEEEFKLAYDHLKEGKKPRFLFVYFKSGQVPIEEINEDLLKISKLKKEIQQYEQLYGSFNSIEDLTQKFQRQLEQVILLEQKEVTKDEEEANEEKAKYDLENYKQHVAQKFRYLDFTGLNAILQKPLELEEVYIKLRARKSSSFEGLHTIADFKLLEKKKEEKSQKKDEEFVTLLEKLHKQKHKERVPLKMLLLGNPGSGKTTLMKWIALQCIRADHPLFSRFIPLFIPLKDLGSRPHMLRKRNINTFAVEFYKNENMAVGSFFDRYFKENRLLFLFDGLDEIGDEKVRREVIDWIQKQYIGGNALVVTSRFSGIHAESGLKFRDDIPVFTIRDFDMPDVEAFLKSWYRNIEISAAGEQGTQKAIEEGNKKSRDLIHTIENSKNLKELAVNPLLLTIIAVVHRTRAVLPRDRHKLYEECLKVMIELWNMSNRKVDISFSFENSIAHLSNIAARLMDTNRREMDKREIEECCLPARVEGQTGDFFLKEMVLKAGLLYESEGKYGFLHLTFQEYLAALYFAGSKNQNNILKYHDRDYWKETFKLFVNIGNAEILFEEIIENLVSKKYWKQIRLWENCVEEIVVEGVKERIGIRFARKVIEILARLEFKKEHEKLINNLFVHPPLYIHGKQLVKEGWDLFNNAPHPFVQSIGTSILNRADDKTGAKLMEELKHRINEFEKQNDESEKALLFFLLQNNNSLPLLLAGSKKITDLNFVLAKLKSGKFFLQYSTLQALQDLPVLQAFQDIPALQALQPLQALPAFPAFPVLPTLPALRDFLNLLDLLDLRDILDTLNLRAFENLQALSETLKQYKNKHKSILKKHQNEIVEWTDRAMEKLHGMPDEDLLKYFPNTTGEELKAFRESYVEIIANELSKGNCDILIGKKLTKKKQKRIEELVTFDEKSVERMLAFELDIQHEEEKHAHHLKAFEILGNNNYEKLYTIIRTFIRSHPDDSIRLHALYIMKNIV